MVSCATTQMLVVALSLALSAASAAAVAPAAPTQLPPVAIAPGVLMPAVNIGHPDDNCTHGLGPGCPAAAQKMTEMWFTLGGRGVDTAAGYQNQPQIGAAIKAAIANGTNRSSIFVTTKVNSHTCTTENTLKLIKADVAQIGVGQLDLVLQHFPCSTGQGNQQVWLGLVKAKQAGLTRAIGVSHYNSMQLRGIMTLKQGQPAVNQCELCVGTHDDDTIKFCKEKGIVYES